MNGKATLDDALRVFRALAPIAEHRGYEPSLAGSTLKRGEGRDVDILLCPTDPIPLNADDTAGAIAKALGGDIAESVQGYFANAYLIRLSGFSVDLQIRKVKNG